MSDTDTGTGTPSATAEEPKTADSTAAADQATQTSTETQKTDAPVTDAETKAPEAEVPESYDLQMPEGIELDTAAADEFSTIARELKLDNAQAQKLADVAVKMQQRQVEAHEKLVQGWVEQTKTDKEIGGDKLEENLAVARKALEAFGDAELKAALNSTGFGNHPAIIRAFVKAGKAISEDGFVKGAPKGPAIDTANKLFPNMN